MSSTSSSSGSSGSSGSTSSSASSSGMPSPFDRTPKAPCTTETSFNQFVGLLGASGEIQVYDGNGSLPGVKPTVAICTETTSMALDYPTFVAGAPGPALLAGARDKNSVDIRYTVEEMLAPGAGSNVAGPYVQMDTGAPSSLILVRAAADGTVFVLGQQVSGPSEQTMVGRPTTPYSVEWQAAKGAQGLIWSIKITDRSQTFSKNGMVSGTGAKTDFWYGLNREAAGLGRMTVSGFTFKAN
jgi:hypothetical protein